MKPFFYIFYFFCFRKEAGNFFAINMFSEKKCFDVLCKCKMARLVWRYSDDAGAIIENVDKLCMVEKKSGMNLSLIRVWDRTAALTGVSRSTTRKLWKRRRRQMTSSNNQSNHRHLRRKCHWMTLTRVLYGVPSPACTP